jgi:ketosteroid isomerase-like protein
LLASLAPRDTAAVPNGRERIILRLYNDGWRHMDFDVVFELVDPGIIWTAIEDAPDAGTYRGHEGVRSYMQDWLDDFDLGEHALLESIEVGDLVVCVWQARATGKGSGVATDINYACMYRFDEGDRIVEVKEFATRGEAVAAAGPRSASETT